MTVRGQDPPEHRVRAVVSREVGAGWQVESVAIGEPVAGQVRVAVDAVGLCRTDLSLARGGLPASFPLVAGHEGIGTVVATAADEYQVGDRVLFVWTSPCGQCWFCARGDNHLCQAEAPAVPRPILDDGTPVHAALGLGAFAEQIIASERSVRHLPIALPDAQAAVLGCAVATGFGAVRTTAGVEAGDSVVVIGAGGIGLSIIQASLDVQAATVIAVDSVASRRDRAAAVGAHATFPPGLSLGRTIRELTGGRGADHVFECVGSASTIRQAWGFTRRGGQVIVVGVGSNTDKLQFSAFELFHTGRRLLGCVYGSFNPDRDLSELCGRVQAGAFDPAAVLDVRAGLAAVADAVAEMDAGLCGRAVFVLNEGRGG